VSSIDVEDEAEGPTIDDATAVGRRIGFDVSFPTSHEDHGPTHHLFVRVRGEEHVGHGEGSALTWFTGDTAETMEHVARGKFLPEVVGRSATDALAAVRNLGNRLPGHPGAQAGVEMALLDLRARQLGVPLWALLGVRRRERIQLAFATGARPAADVAADAAEAYDDGFRAFKIKADGDLAGDARRINAVTDRLTERGDPADLAVRVDANTGWESVERARRAIGMIDRKETIEYFEQPVAADAIGDLRALRTNVGVPVFADEAVHGLDDLQRLTGETPAVSGICAKLAKVGSLYDLVTLGRVADANGFPVSLVSAFETSLGVAANLHVAAVLPRLSAAAELGANLLAADPVEESLSTSPSLPVPSNDGVGVRLNANLFADAPSVDHSR
jgi:L-alanine-DL-glutamate epimerase-like enolase superfamily enzyme